MGKKVAITWEMIKDFAFNQSPCLFTNKQCAKSLNADPIDVSALTRIMAKAGELVVFHPETPKGPITNLYRDISTPVFIAPSVVKRK